MIMSFFESDLWAGVGIVLAVLAVYELLLILPMRLSLLPCLPITMPF